MTGWFNVDIANSDQDVDLAAGQLPWPDDSFEVVVSQHVIEHLELETELLPLFRELNRVIEPGGTIWLSCPDLEKVCRSYIDNRGDDLVRDRQSRYTEFTLGDVPTQHFINVLFHQSGEHRNLFDFELLAWALHQARFINCRRVVERDLLSAHPEFSPRHDDVQTLYVAAEVAAG